MNLDSLSHELLMEIVSYLDVGHIISVMQVNGVLRNALMNDRWLWLCRLQHGLKVGGRLQEWQHPFDEIIRHVGTWRCSDCLEMELDQRPFIDLFFKKTLCKRCKRRPKYAPITLGTAKRNYFLNERDLLPLKTMSVENPHYKNASPVRLYSREVVQKVSGEKLRCKGIDRDEHCDNSRIEEYE